jgi:hypothetical protein
MRRTAGTRVTGRASCQYSSGLADPIEWTACRS